MRLEEAYQMNKNLMPPEVVFEITGVQSGKQFQILQMDRLKHPRGALDPSSFDAPPHGSSFYVKRIDLASKLRKLEWK